MSYVVRIVGPSGRVTFLRDQLEVDIQADADHFMNRAYADGAADMYRDVVRKFWRVPPMVDVVDTNQEPRDP